VKRQPSSGGGMYHSEIRSEMPPSGSGGSDIKNILNAVGGGSFKWESNSTTDLIKININLKDIIKLIIL
jgi:hypothetical protein